ncbi:MAG: cellulase family glycosylhydrolase [Chloroflexi bacterium]|nr:cellulase family glycosylhydrolase [Chloroflexota bacterium]
MPDPRRLLRGSAPLALAMLLIVAPQASAQTPSTTAAPNGWGYGFQVQMWHFDSSSKEHVVSDVKQAGFNWMTHQVEWQAVETAPGEYEWSELDGIVSNGFTAGLNIMLSVAHAPVFYRSPTSGLMPADPTTFNTFMQALATRYAGQVQAYEVWNEQNLAREAGDGNVDPSTYLPLMEAGATGVRAGDPSARVLLGAPSPTGANIPGESMDDLSYLTQLYAINNGEVAQYFDVLSAHPSGFSNPPDCTPDTPQCSFSGSWNDDPSFFALYRVGQYYNLMQSVGDGGKQIWLTEFGYCSNQSPPPGYEYCKYITEDQQALFLQQAYQLARNTPYIGAMFAWNLNFQLAVPQTDEKWGFGIIRSDWSARPAYGRLLGMPKP